MSSAIILFPSAQSKIFDRLLLIDQVEKFLSFHFKSHSHWASYKISRPLFWSFFNLNNLFYIWLMLLLLLLHFRAFSVIILFSGRQFRTMKRTHIFSACPVFRSSFSCPHSAHDLDLYQPRLNFQTVLVQIWFPFFAHVQTMEMQFFHCQFLIEIFFLLCQIMLAFFSSIPEMEGARMCTSKKWTQIWIRTLVKKITKFYDQIRIEFDWNQFK